MKFARYELRKAYFDAIGTSITVSGTPVKVYDMEAPINAVRPFIIISSFSQSNDLDTKDGFGGTVTANIEVSTEKVEPYGGTKQADEIMNSFLTIINPNTNTVNLTSTNFNFISVQLVGSYDGFNDGDSETNYRVVSILQHKFFEK